MNYTYNIEGMSCGHCAMKVSNALSGLMGVQSADVDLEKGVVNVTANVEISESAAAAAVEEAGYRLVPSVATT